MTSLSADKKSHPCPMCLHLNSIDEHQCFVCERKIKMSNSNSLQNTLALLVTSVILYIPANLYPIMYTVYLGEQTESTILGGVITLWQQGSYPIAAIIFIASVVIPLLKILALAFLCLAAIEYNSFEFKQHHKVLRLTEMIGRWSMVDIYVVTILVALIQMGNIMSVYPGYAAFSFAAMVVTTMLAAMSFDPKLIWYKKLKQNRQTGQ